jgi:F1F0 ATPase subunit 2
MAMNESLALVLAWMAGVGIGAIFFGGLWWTVRKGLGSRRPALWLFGSLLLRVGVTLTGFYVVGHGHWQRLVACLVGFVMARLAVTWLAQSPGQPRPAQEASHAP